VTARVSECLTTGVTNASALHSCPLTRRSNARRPNAADACIAPPRCVCGTAKAYRLHVAVRGCALLATDSRERPAVAAQSVTAWAGEMTECTRGPGVNRTNVAVEWRTVFVLCLRLGQGSNNCHEETNASRKANHSRWDDVCAHE
jgi:hypothetical protein